MGSSATQRGFTLLEVAISTVIIGVGFLAALQLSTASTRQTADSYRMNIAASLANNVREVISRKEFDDPQDGRSIFGPEAAETDVSKFDDVDDFSRATFSPPIDAVDPLHPQQVASLAGYTQVVRVTPVDALDFTRTIAMTSNYSALRVSVDVLYASNPGAEQRNIYTLSWTEFAR